MAFANQQRASLPLTPICPACVLLLQALGSKGAGGLGDTGERSGLASDCRSPEPLLTDPCPRLQNTYLRAESCDPTIWRAHCLSRWPNADVQLHGGSWPRLFGARSGLPVAFPLAADRIRTATAAAAGSPSFMRSALEEVMRCLDTVATAVSADRAVKVSLEFAAVKGDVAWWLSERPDLLVSFVRSASELVHASFDMWTAPLGSLSDVAWRCRAVEALSSLGLLGAAHASVASRLRAEGKALKRAVHAAQGVEEAY